MMKLFLDYFFLFFLYSIIGWILETSYVAIKNKKIVDRGFLIGPYCPIYGVGSLGIILYLTQYRDNIVTVFILGCVICSILEYFTSYIMEVLFKTRWWDYSNERININGRICLVNSILFGIASVLVIYLVQPNLDLIISNMNTKFLVAISTFCLIIFIIDVIISLNVANKFKNTVIGLDRKKDSTQEFSVLVKETIKNNKQIFQSRLYKGFPNIDLNKLRDLKKETEDGINDIKDDIKEFREDIEDDIKNYLKK